MDLYRDLILDHYKHPRNFGKLTHPTHTSDGANASCGDSMHMEVVVADGTVHQVAFTGVGCAISQASASLLSEYITGKGVKEVLQIRRETIESLLGTPLTPARVKCALLPLEVLHDALGRSSSTK